MKSKELLNYMSILLIILCLSLSSLYGQAVDYVPGQVLIKMKQGKSAIQKNALKNQMEGTVRKSFPQLGVELWEIGTAQKKVDIRALISQYENHPDIEFVEPNYIVSIGATIPDDSSFGNLWGQNNTGQNGGTPDADIDAPEAWDIATESPDVVVGIIDTGIDWGHEDLVDNTWQNLGEDADGDGKVIEWNGTAWVFDPGDENNVDDDGNGYVDDFVGWDFRNNDNDPYDGHSHGTHCAGTVGASGNNNLGVVGVTWNVQLAGLKFLSDGGSGSTADAVDALNYAVAMGIPITNNSWGGGGYSATMYQALQNAETNGHLFFASAGNNYGSDNDANPRYPTGYDTDNVVSVASTTNTDGVSGFSNIGATTVDLGAPGSGIYSSVPFNQYSYKSGTSMATPQVVGACALLWGQYPNKSAAEIKEALLNSTDNIVALNGKCLSEGRLNVHKALLYFTTSCREIDSLALVALYNSAGGANWTTSWNLNQAMDTWYGVTLNANGCVVELDLFDNQLSGNIAPELGDIIGLTSLKLGTNQLTGSVPSSLGNLSNLTNLNLYNNALTGSIPPSLGSLDNLISLFLSANQLSGSIPVSLGNLTSITQLGLSDNNLNGSIPPIFASLANLEFFGIKNNQLSGCYDTGLVQLCTQLPPAFNINANISAGNNFDAPWEDFCNSGAGGCPAGSGCRYTDSLALVALYDATDGDNWTISWNLYEPIDTWNGILLNNDGCVQALVFGSNNMTGNLPSELGNLSALLELTINSNNLTGSIPPSLGNLSNLWTLRLGSNDLSGNIPPELGNLSALTYLSLYSNNLSGSIPSELGDIPDLWSLYLSNNNLTGSIPASLGNLGSLNQLRLNNNNLTGAIPPSLGNLSSLEYLYADNNELSGSIPQELGNLSSLAVLYLSYNQLSGSIPTSLGNLSSLDVVFLNNNNLTGLIPPSFGNANSVILKNNQLSGSIPVELLDMNNLVALSVSNNQLSGCYDPSLTQLCTQLTVWNDNANISVGNNFDVPWEDFCSSGGGGCTAENSCRYLDSLVLVDLYDATDGANWTNSWNLSQTIDNWYGVTLNANGCVEFLNLYQNGLSGSLPADLGNLSVLKSLILYGNELSGSIPPELGNLSALESLILYGNELSGSIPAELGNLSALTSLQLSGNNLTGSIPSSLGNLNSLTALSIYDNALSGSIPPELGDLSNLNELLLSLNQLSGSIPPELGNLNNLLTLWLQGNNLTGSIPSALSNVQNLGAILLYDNQLSGTIPPSFESLSNLSALQLDLNQLSGTIPSFLGNMTNLTSLNLSNNQFSGCYDSNLSSLCTQLNPLSSTNNKISNGNNLDAPWEDFCSTGGGDCTAQTGCRYIDSLALVALYDAAGGANWNNVWDLSEPFDSWYGVSVNSDGCVRTLNVLGNGLVGTIPQDVTNLSALTYLNLSTNNLTGPIPSSMDNLTNLTDLSLYFNSLSGPIPSELGNLTNLTELHLFRNDLSGPIPPSLGDLANLIALRLDQNELTGIIPPSLANLDNIILLSFNDNNLTGSFPAFLGDYSNLLNFTLSNNQLSGCYDSNLSTLCTQLNSGLNNNLNISNGNNFDAPWEDFCNNGAGECGGQGACRYFDSLTLVTLYDATDGANWTNSWNLSQAMDTWDGVSLNASGCVEILDLTSNGLFGSLPTELGNLSELTTLYLKSNQLNGAIPLSLGNLNSLNTLWLLDNQLSGTIPATLGDLANLEVLLLNDNNLSGTIPPELGNLSNLRTLHLRENQLSGSIPTELSDLTSLVTLYLNSNQLTGSIPASLGNLSNLKTFVAYSNQLTGSIPTSLGSLGELTTLSLEYNDLTGSIPSSLGNLSNLTSLLLGGNNLTGSIPASLGNLSNLGYLGIVSNQLSGSIPSELGNLSNLVSIDVRFNDLTGSIPSSLGSLSNLDRLSLSNNQLSGCYDSNLSQLCTQLSPVYNTNSRVSYGNNFDAPWEDFCNNGAGDCTVQNSCRYLDSLTLVTLYDATDGANWTNIWNLNQPIDSWYGVSLSVDGCVETLNLMNNGLVGSIPVELGDLSNLTTLYLKSNQLSGTIPSSLGNLNNLNTLWLQDNQLSGSIPSELGDLANLDALLLQDNNLSGDIPSSLSNLSNLTALWLYSNQLTGSIPSSLGNLGNLNTLLLEYNNLSGAIPSSLGNLSNLTALRLGANDLTGSIPPSLGNLSNLETLNIFLTQLSGNIPPELGNLSNLESMNLKFNDLTGSIPPSLGNLDNLINLWLDGNELSGLIPSSFSSLSNLVGLTLNNNQLSGCYDSSLSQFCTQLSPTYNNNASISAGNNFDMPWEDFCSNGPGNCTVSVVWPGDFNNDGEASNEDVMYWGLAETNTGLVRPNASTNWIGQSSIDWTTDASGINNKHQDADGNGSVDIQDLQVLIDNYGSIHAVGNTDNMPNTVEFRLEPISSSPTGATTTIEYALFAEEAGAPAEIHGAACDITFDGLNLISASMDVSNSSLEPAEQLGVSNGNRLEIGLTRTDQVNKICVNPIATITAIVATEDVPDGLSFGISTSAGSMIKADGSVSAASDNTFYSVYSENSASSTVMLLWASVEHVQCLSSGSAEVFISGGLGAYEILWSTGATTAEISDLSPGIYTVTVNDANGLTSTLSLEIEGQYLPVYDEFGNLIPCGSAVTCPSVIDFIDNLPNGTHQASGAINTNAQVTTGDAPQLKAGNVILLQPGFSVPPGSSISVEIGDCGN